MDVDPAAGGWVGAAATAIGLVVKYLSARHDATKRLREGDQKTGWSRRPPPPPVNLETPLPTELPVLRADVLERVEAAVRSEADLRQQLAELARRLREAEVGRERAEARLSVEQRATDALRAELGELHRQIRGTRPTPPVPPKEFAHGRREATAARERDPADRPTRDDLRRPARGEGTGPARGPDRNPRR